jgi:hypothetical protein
MATLYGGSLRMHTPLVFTVGFLVLFTFGGFIYSVSSPKIKLYAGRTFPDLMGIPFCFCPLVIWFLPLQHLPLVVSRLDFTVTQQF